MSKIALLTFHDTTNFGALLQAFALYKKVNDLGHDCSVLNYQCENIIKREVPPAFRLTINPKKLLIEALVNSKKRKRYKAMSSFSKTYMPNKSIPYNRESVFHVKEDFDTYLVGSDMLWGLNITNHDFSYFLDFVSNDKRKVSYATSIGKEWNADEVKIISRLLNDFDSVSVREDHTREILSNIIKRCDVVCDPTMLITSEEWEKYVSNRFSNEDYVLAYFNTDDGKSFRDARTYAKAHGKKLIIISSSPNKKKGVKHIYPYKVEDFLSLIFYADTVFTASYHGLLFSLYFHKNFIYYNRQPAYRMQTVAKRIGVVNREGYNVDLNDLPPVDFEAIDSQIDGFRKTSLQFLVNSLG